MEANVNPEDWQRECERVSTRFKTQDRGDIKEWRTHLEQAKVYSEVLFHPTTIEGEEVVAGCEK
jgi:hypothetical protein